ncbi:MAG: PAS domain S-box protein [Holophagae bacterium]
MSTPFRHDRSTTDTAVCPVTGLPVVRRAEWTSVEVDDGYVVSIEVIGGHIVLTTIVGHATLAGFENVIALRDGIIAEEVDDGAPYVMVLDYRRLTGSTPAARRQFTADLRQRTSVAGVAFFGVPPLLRLPIRLGSQFLLKRIPVTISENYAQAVRWAVDRLAAAGVELSVTAADPTKPRSDTRAETGTFEIDGYRVSYEVIDGHILHGSSIGILGLHQIERQIEIEDVILGSIDRDGPLPVVVVDASRLDGISAAARRLYITAARTRQKNRPVALYAFYGVRPSFRRAINISRPFLPFRVRIARDRETALTMARRERSRWLDRSNAPHTSGLSPERTDGGPSRPDIEELVRRIADIDWTSDAPVEAGERIAPDDPLAPVVDALALIKSDIDELLRARRRTEEALRESEQRYRGILASIVDGYYEIDLDGRLLFWNDALLRIFGFTRTEIDDIEPKSLMDERNLQLALDTFRQVHETGRPATATNLEMRLRDGNPVNIEISISPVLDTDGRAVGFRGIVRDISERVRDAEEKADLEAQLQRSQRMEAIGTLAGGIAHNFNNLLMGIQGNVSLLLQELPEDHPHNRRLRTMEALVDGGSRLTSQLLGYARAGRVEVRVVDLNSLVAQTAETFSLTRREYRVHSRLTERTLPVEVDPGQIEQALFNLLINAAEAMPGGGDISITSRRADHTELDGSAHDLRQGHYAVIEIGDTGCGMDGSTIDRIFEPFFTTKGMTGGTGLGLSSAYGIVRAHGGRIDVESEVGTGSTFKLVLPTAGRDVERTSGTREGAVKGQGTILVVEDDDAVLDACTSMLSLLRYTPLAASSGDQAVEIFRRHRDEIDLVVLDLILTDMSGGEVFDRIRAIDPDIRVLLASGYSLDGEAAGILDRGCDDFIQKPFTVEQLSHKLKTLLHGSS